MKCYKRVRKINGRYFSFFSKLSDFLKIEYKIGEISKPVTGTIGIFIEKIKPYFAGRGITVLECECKKIKTTAQRIHYMDLYEITNIKQYKKLKNNIYFQTESYVVDELIPIKEIHEDSLRF